LKIAEANFRQARTAIRFNRAAEAPTIGTSPSISAIRSSANQPYFPASQANNGSGEFALPFDLSYEIDLWGRIRRSVTAAREEAQAGAADLETARLSLHAELAVDYFEVRSADAQEQLLSDTVEAYTKALQLTENRFEGGAAPKSDVAQAKTQLDAARVLATEIRVQRSQYEHALAILIGKPPAAFSLIPIPLNVQPPELPAVPVAARGPGGRRGARYCSGRAQHGGVERADWNCTGGLLSDTNLAAVLASKVIPVELV
jgi:outer membrane protein TolC